MTATLRALTGRLRSGRGRRLGWTLGAIAVLLLIVTLLLVTTARSWAGDNHTAQVLLPGTLVAEVPVGGLAAEDATAAVTAALDERLERRVTLHHEGDSWTTSLAELGARVDVPAAIDEALHAASASPTFELVRVRWFGAEVGISVHVPIRVGQDRLDALVAELAEELDEGARTASLAWQDGDVTLLPAAKGLDVDREVTTQALLGALRGETDEVDVSAEVLAPDVDTATAEAALDLMRRPLDAALDRAVSVVHEDESWTVTPRGLDAVPDLGPLFEAAVTTVRSGGSGDDLRAEVPLDISEDTLSEFLAGIASGLDVAPRDARLDHSTGWIEFVPSRDGLAVDREKAATELVAALRGEDETVSLDIGPDPPRVTLDDLRHVLLVRQGERRVYLYRDGRIVRDWPVAVGLAGSPTPTGVFTIGAKRANPTWYNPSPGGWGSDMPAVIGPGPDNPLGLRALNWNRDGRDTLIRFHGTPNEASIGEAASRGCVRMRNADVIELFDLVPSGATVVSLNVGTPPPPVEEEEEEEDDEVEEEDEPDANERRNERSEDDDRDAEGDDEDG